MKRIIKPLLLDQATSLHQVPSTLWRQFTLDIRKLIQRNPGAVHADLLRRTTQSEQTIQQRLRSGEHQRAGLEQLAKLHFIGRIMRSRLNIHAVKRDDDWLRPTLNDGQQVNSCVAEVNMQEVCVTTFQ